MSVKRKITVNDVALKSGVSMSLAAAVLRNADSSIKCTGATRERILKAAHELNYKVNGLARAMKTGIVPQVALCVHHHTADDELNLYLHDLLPSVVSALKPRGFNVTFIPYDSIEDFTEQTQAVADSNLISGIITNCPSKYEATMVGHLKKLGLPHVIFGNIQDSSAPSVCLDDTAQIKVLSDYARLRGFKQAVKMLAEKRLNGDILWTPAQFLFPLSPHECDISSLDLHNSDTLWVAFGEFTRRRLLHDAGVSPGNIISVESKSVLIQFKPTLFVKNKLGARADIAAGMLLEWILDGRIPEPRRRSVCILPEDIELIV